MKPQGKVCSGEVPSEPVWWLVARIMPDIDGGIGPTSRVLAQTAFAAAAFVGLQLCQSVVLREESKP